MYILELNYLKQNLDPLKKKSNMPRCILVLGGGVGERLWMIWQLSRR
jgi:hypothetical protein